jgi:hypothetical protein
LNEGIWHKNRIAQQLGFHSKAPFEVHSDCEARLDIPVPATKKSQSLMTGFLHFKKCWKLAFKSEWDVKMGS